MREKERGRVGPKTSVYSDRLSIHYPPISDAFNNRVFFLHYTNDSTLILLRNSLFNINAVEMIRLG